MSGMLWPSRLDGFPPFYHLWSLSDHTFFSTFPKWKCKSNSLPPNYVFGKQEILPTSPRSHALHNILHFFLLWCSNVCILYDLNVILQSSNLHYQLLIPIRWIRNLAVSPGGSVCPLGIGPIDSQRWRTGDTDSPRRSLRIKISVCVVSRMAPKMSTS